MKQPKNNDDTPPCDQSVLDRAGSPPELRKLPRADLPRLAREVREEILCSVCETGGHLASSLGVVELTIALHYVFNTPDDRVIWDVGHQCYPHKILTGRRDRFASIRSMGGLSGFPKRSESPYDPFGAGHASTSISAAMGMAEAARLDGRPDHVVAVIGDGGLTGGMALEGLNQTREDLPNLTVILNDNEMSIAPSVGSLSTFLSRSVAAKWAFNLAKLMRRLAQPLPPWLFNELSWLGRRWRQSFQAFWTPGALFESLGYHYIGPIDGHRFEQLLPALQQARDVEKPFLVHVLTTKGKGYFPAEDSPCSFHGVGPFDLATGAGKKKNGPPSYTKVFSDALIELMKDDHRLVGITAAMPQGTGLDKVAEAYPHRVFDMGITEQHCVTFAAGMACDGFRPAVAVYSTFIQRAYDQLVHDVCLQDLPVIICLDRGGLVGEDGPTHHGLFDLAFLRSLPNMSVLSPADENELRHMLHATSQYQGGPVTIRYPRGGGVGMPLDSEWKSLPWGRGEVMRAGTDMAIVAIGNCVHPALAAAESMERQGVNAAVINARFVKPLDRELMLSWAESTGMIVTVEEGVLEGGFGSAVLELISDAGLAEVVVHRIGIPDQFVEHGTLSELRAKYGLDADGIARSCLELAELHQKPSKKAAP